MTSTPQSPPSTAEPSARYSLRFRTDRTGYALAWLLREPVVSTVLVAAKSDEQLPANLGGFEVHLGENVLQRLDHIWPDPGEAQQAYAR
jgi:aryl-alcohol dehydrogenase-like predicted oxidoreductase